MARPLVVYAKFIVFLISLSRVHGGGDQGSGVVVGSFTYDTSQVELLLEKINEIKTMQASQQIVTSLNFNQIFEKLAILQNQNAELSKQFSSLSGEVHESNQKWLDLKNEILSDKEQPENEKRSELNTKFENFEKTQERKSSEILEKISDVQQKLKATSTESAGLLRNINDLMANHATRLESQFSELRARNESCANSNPGGRKIPQIDDQVMILSERLAAYSGCVEAVKNNGHSGVYSIRTPTDTYSTFKAFCLKDPEEKGEAWTLVMRRQLNSSHFIDFKRNWTEYRDGFGDRRFDHWLGLQHIFTLTNSTKHQFWVYLEYGEGETVESLYNDFSVASESDDFAVSLNEWTDGFGAACSDVPFNTFDRGNTTYVNEQRGAGYWGPCFLPFTSQKFKDNKLTIGLKVGEINVHYAHIAMRPLSI